MQAGVAGWHSAAEGLALAAWLVAAASGKRGRGNEMGARKRVECAGTAVAGL